MKKSSTSNENKDLRGTNPEQSECDVNIKSTETVMATVKDQNSSKNARCQDSKLLEISTNTMSDSEGNAGSQALIDVIETDKNTTNPVSDSVNNYTVCVVERKIENQKKATSPFEGKSEVSDFTQSLLQKSDEDSVDTNTGKSSDVRQSLMVADDALMKREPCANIKLFLVNYGFLLLFYMAQNIYNIGVIRTIERKYGLRSAQTGFIMSSNDISHIMVVIFVGYFGKKAHKPRFLSVSLLLCALAAFLMATPYFIWGTGTVVESEPEGLVVDPQQIYQIPDNLSYIVLSDLEDVSDKFCDPDRDEYECTDEQVEADSSNMAAYYIMLLAQFISGAGGSGITTLGFSYIDENAPSHRSALYIGLVSSIFSFAPVAALGLAALCLKLPENPAEETTLQPGDPQWIGCWWLGYVICGIGVILSCVPMWFFPKYIIKHEKSDKQKETDAMSIKQQLKMFPKSTLHLLKNAPYMMLVLMSVLLMYVVTVLYSNMPRYIEVHFHKPAFAASFVAISGAAMGVVGGLTGGLIMNKRKTSPKGATKITMFSSGVMCLGVAITMFLACPQLQMAGQWQDGDDFSVSLPCNKDCACVTTRQAYAPVCGEDGLTYFSPCHAGCTDLNDGNYTSCSCILHGDTSLPGMAASGSCGIQCNMLTLYIITFCIFSLLGSICRAPTAIVLFRVVGDDQRPFALAISSFACNLLAFIPAPVMFGAMIDSTCILWSTTCSGTGSCLLYDTKKFRLAIHGSALLFKILAFVCSIVIYMLVKKMHFPDKNITTDVVVDKMNETQMSDNVEFPEKGTV